MKSSSGLETDTLYICTYTIYSVKWEELFGINQAENSNFDRVRIPALERHLIKSSVHVFFHQFSHHYLDLCSAMYSPQKCKILAPSQTDWIKTSISQDPKILWVYVKVWEVWAGTVITTGPFQDYIPYFWLKKKKKIIVIANIIWINFCSIVHGTFLLT